MFNKWFKLISNSSPMMDSIGCRSSTDQNSLDESDERSSIAKLVDSTPANTPFRKKAITSIERTRKLSILLRHQHYLVSKLVNQINKLIGAGNHYYKKLTVYSFFLTFELYMKIRNRVAHIENCVYKNIIQKSVYKQA